MPDLDITIGGRVFQVACQPGEEPFLQAAAQLLDNEAQPLIAQMGRMPEVRILLMAGLMLADKTAALEDEVKGLRARLADADRPGATDTSKAGTTVSPALAAGFADLLKKAEGLATQIESRVRGA